MDKKKLKSRPIPKPRIGKAARPTLTPRGHKTISDKPIPLIDVPILEPTPYVEPKGNLSTIKSLAKSAVDRASRKLNEFANWILSYTPEEIKKKQ